MTVYDDDYEIGEELGRKERGEPAPNGRRRADPSNAEYADSLADDGTADEPRAAPADHRMPDMLRQLREWLDLPDQGPIIVSCAAAATTSLDDDEAAWLLNVAPPSAGKTEAVNLLDKVTDARLNEITSAGLLGWSRGKTPRPTGVLSRIGANAMVTFGDLSSLLATSDRGGRDAVFGLLRRAYDGHVSRDVQPPGGRVANESLSWSGRLTVIAAVTSAIDNYSAHADALGPRWIYIRAAERGIESRRNAAKAARNRDVRTFRAEAANMAAEIITEARARIAATTVPDAVADAIEDAVLVTCWGRAVVPRNGYGRREIEGVPITEEPPRLIRQIHVLARGLYALGYDDDDVTRLTRRVALDSMPTARLGVLRALADDPDEVLTTAAVARRARLHWYVAHRHCEDLAAIGVVDELTGADTSDSDSDRNQRRWLLTKTEGQVIRDVIAASTLHEM
jgi:hypothetical protein